MTVMATPGIRIAGRMRLLGALLAALLSSCNGSPRVTKPQPSAALKSAAAPQSPPSKVLPSSPGAANKAPAPALSQSDAWQTVVEAEAKDRAAWFSAIWVSEQRTLYVAGNRGVMRRNSDGTVDTFTPVEDDVLLGVWGESDSAVYAVGGRGSVTRYDGTRWVLERKPGPKAPRSRELLHSIGHFALDGSLVAFGPSLSIQRAPGGAWSALMGARVQQAREHRGTRVPDHALCEKAGVQYWHPDQAGNVWVQCQDRSTYWLTSQRAEPHGLAPRDCANAYRHVFLGDALYVTCNGALFRNRGVEWEREQVGDATDELRDLFAREGCLFVASKRAVFQRCPRK